VPAYACAILLAGWLVWVAPFFMVRRGVTQPAGEIDRRARWGVLLVALSYSLLWQGRFWERSLPVWRLGLSVTFLSLAGLLSWTSARTLGRQWRIDAGLNADHELMTAGPYRWVRHPIYTSMLCLALGTGFMLAPLIMLALATVVFMVGTEIRVRIEDRLLASRFGDRFHQYQRAVPAYLPFTK
jgi:protein-S-isoprenylcysteine O-methyltransferase Ste14